MAESPQITVFTPTYNRAHTIHRVFDSLCAQTFSDFEWLIIDDGSSDNTKDLIETWTATANFSIRYVRQLHIGKNFAHNLALAEARGYLFFPIDSDDAFVPDALEKMARLWASIPESKRHNFCSVGALCQDQHGKIVGQKFPTEPFDADLLEVTYIRHIGGEKWIGWVTEIMRRYPFPEIHGTFLPEGIICFDIAKSFKTRWSNDVVRTYYVDDPTTGATLTGTSRGGSHALGRWYYYVWLLNNNLGYFFNSPSPFLKAATALSMCGWLSGHTLAESLRALGSKRARLLVLLALPFAVLLFEMEKRAQTAYRRARARDAAANE